MRRNELGGGGGGKARGVGDSSGPNEHIHGGSVSPKARILSERRAMIRGLRSGCDFGALPA